MKRALAVGAALALALAISCSVPDSNFRVRDGGGSADGRSDGNPDGTPPPCDVTMPWGPLSLVPGLPQAQLRSVARFTPDERTAYFGMGSGGTFGSSGDTDALFVATRNGSSAAFSSATNLLGVNGSDGMSSASISADGATLYYTWGEPPVHPAGGAARDIYTATMMGPATFTSAMPIDIDGSGVEENYPYIASDGTLWYVFKGSGGSALRQIYSAGSIGSGQFAAGVPANSLNDPVMPSTYPTVSADLLHIYYQRGGSVFTASRGSAGEAFGSPAGIPEINNNYCSGTTCRPAWISPDNCRLYLGVAPLGSAITMYVTSRP